LVFAGSTTGTSTQFTTSYRIDSRADRAATLTETFSDRQLAVLEKLNRADLAHLSQLPQLVVPNRWAEDDLAYSMLPLHYEAGVRWPTFVIVYLPGQVFGAYEFGKLVRWGPVSSGGRANPTPSGLFALTWRSAGRASTVNPDWFLRWYFNFGNREGLAFHAYELPGHPASHGCIRLLERDAQWLFEWGQTWTLDSTGTRILQPGTPVFIVGEYGVEGVQPWRSPTWLRQNIALPAPPVTP